MTVGQRPSVPAACVLDDIIEPLCRNTGILRLELAQRKVGQHRHARPAVRANRSSVLQQRQSRIRGNDDAVGLAPRNVKDVVQRPVQRVIAVAQ